jgi:hypothetical protein
MRFVYESPRVNVNTTDATAGATARVCLKYCVVLFSIHTDTHSHSTGSPVSVPAPPVFLNRGQPVVDLT